MPVDLNKLPLHVAITMDGNGRWATQKNLPRTSGHNQGLKTAKNIVKAAVDLGIKHLTLYVFSTENWKRAEQEVGFLMNLIHVHLIGELEFYKQNQIKINHIGNLEALPKNIQKDIIEAKEKTKDFNRMTVNLAINYGGRDEIVSGIKKIINAGKNEEEIDEKTVSSFLDMPESPDVDLLIRTGGEKRLSGFLIWQSAYSEFYFTKVYWPDFDDEELKKAITEYSNRKRNFGK